ncbi:MULTISPECIES: S8 family serine peptidase [Streptomyces]|uniref:S8 family serine peptidase n=1 Tax=Streptomyces TaxID=1883 RepID=UPI00200E782F|nr:S8 family serine peptidase [Streptomyces virginiae]
MFSYPGQAGADVTAYVIDTGVRIPHQEFGGRAFNGYDAVDRDSVAEDGNGHGTHVAATIAGAPAMVSPRRQTLWLSES